MVALKDFLLVLLIGGVLSSSGPLRPPSYKEHIAVEGQSYTIPCDTTVNADVRWFFKSSATGRSYRVYDQGRTWEPFLSRFSLNTSVPLLYGLDILNVHLNDTGNYTCVDNIGYGDDHIHNLFVQVRPRSYIAVQGQSCTIPCDTTVDADVKWLRKSKVTGWNWPVYDQGRILDSFLSRFSLNTSVPLLYGLDISNVQLNDAGNYTCVDDFGQGQEHIHYLFVQGLQHELANCLSENLVATVRRYRSPQSVVTEM